MVNNLNTIEAQLIELCCSVMEKLDMLKEKGIISEEQYMYHTARKKEFLNEVRNKYGDEAISETVVHDKC